ncbi:hypothetical protein B0H17DRAFT_1195506 [Mycena rosella]|uniref:F-box domain-containing protein n=1 Tax=Mycena rosella TaxID=1033263 RepID=A0AAD7DYY7_MYCRO|nr:hypothetical protein B0H17DRAFT_1195506 [Mycena rosella]
MADAPITAVWLRGEGNAWNASKILPAGGILAPYGRTIRFLSLSNFTDPQTSIHGLLNACPSLEHLAVNEPLCISETLKHKTITSVDVFCFPDGRSPVTFELLKAGLPALRNFRALDVTIGSMWDIPAGSFSTDERSWQTYYQDTISREDGPESAWIADILATDLHSDDSDGEDHVCDEDTDEDTDEDIVIESEESSGTGSSA